MAENIKMEDGRVQFEIEKGKNGKKLDKDPVDLDVVIKERSQDEEYSSDKDYILKCKKKKESLKLTL